MDKAPGRNTSLKRKPYRNSTINTKEFHKSANKRLRKKYYESLYRQMLCGPDLSYYARVKQITETGHEAFFRLRQFLANPPFRYILQAEKALDVLGIGLKFAVVNVILFLGAATLAVLFHDKGLGLLPLVLELSKWRGVPTDPVLGPIFAGWAALAGATVLTTGRKLLWRLGDKDVRARTSA